jgi:hypothetical protein
MKHSTNAKTFAFAAVTALALTMAPAATAANKGCSNASLMGTFAYTTIGSFVAAPAPLGPYAEVGTQTFDGIGTTTTAGTSSTSGSVAQSTSSGTYTVNADCTGTFILPIAPGISAHYFFVIADTLDSFQAVCTDPVAVITRTARLQFPALGDWRR